MQCYNCGKNAMYVVDAEEGNGTPLCLDCWIRYVDIHQRQVEALQRQMNYLHDEADAIVGLGRMGPRYPEPRRTVIVEGATLNNFSISNSQVGVINTGTVENIDATVSVLKSSGNDDLALALTELVQAVLSTDDLAAQSKNRAVELLNELGEQVVAPPEKRRTAVARAVLSDVGTILSGVASLSVLWDKLYGLLGPVLGI